jgi:hypothetical protein
MNIIPPSGCIATDRHMEFILFLRYKKSGLGLALQALRGTFDIYLVQM